MRAIVKTRPGAGLEVTDAPEPGCGPRDVLIRVRHAGVCGTDLHIAEWDEWARGRIKPPVVLGHEFAGEIVQIGSDVDEAFAVGQLVTAEGHIVCGHCRPCRTGNGHICQRTQIIGVDRDGAFTDLIAMPSINVMPLGEIPTTLGAIMDPLGNAFHTVLTGGDVAGAAVLVLGCGPIGCFAVGIAVAAGASRVIATDINATRRSLATTMGAHVVLDPGASDVVARVREETDGDGADLVCEMSGHPSAIQQAFRAARLGGRVNLLGLPRGEVPVRLSEDVIFRGLSVYGVVGRRMYETWHQMRTFLSSGLLDPTPVVTHVFGLEDIAGALEAIRSGEAGKVILTIGGE
ncbi:MAG TPA: L-threonine 3-dehydrogenase [Gemmatimonadales bacterium]|jgi:threonine 3-dehydrogenase